ncbi:hypothetical protein JAAARDRAFT_34027 [Jaapia argillacea MUCL 33604]|uniref:Uncharacterized protein n=1 Tax=Jaapia argillacea MUCL 33604 TaxID=933084 RepID=A0A067Q722_9AGAM|nr:hypothetical protein JAAARDRAFT_34027 [Jaapia argillacea MUCL 33604]
MTILALSESPTPFFVSFPTLSPSEAYHAVSSSSSSSCFRASPPFPFIPTPHIKTDLSTLRSRLHQPPPIHIQPPQSSL